MQTLLWLAVLAGALLVLVRSADWFTDGAEAIGIAFGLPAYVVGVTIVAVGTSLPELVSSVIAVLRGNPEIVLGNVIGSNVTNIFLVLGVAAILGGRLWATWEIIHVDLPLLVGSAFLLAIIAWDGSVTVPEALICLAGTVIYVSYAVSMSLSREHKHTDIEQSVEEELGVQRGRFDRRTWLKIAVGVVGVYFGAEYTVRAVVELSVLFNVGTDIIALSAVALGTSLPELVVSVVAARKGNLEVAIGNVLGSSVFNSFAVVGVAGLFGTLVVAPSVLTLGLPVMVVATLLYFFMVQDKEITSWEGWLLVVFYLLFLLKLFGIA
ncbi:MAG: calcium/sodium antiporter [Coriobacteriia bacterium]|nr:calcium/sodium antiporter [Coriobacteriia bacterium]MBN2822533.1 calcium/sodium antiporter [Coriobacteriia bacterium]